MNFNRWPRWLLAAVAAAAASSTWAAGCASDARLCKGRIPQLSPAQPGPLLACETLTTFGFARTAITGASVVPAGTLTVAGQPIGEHCLVTGSMNERVSPVDGQTYRIGFEMRLPRDWNGRFLHQGNGGTDGRIATAVGDFSGGGQLSNALQTGFAVLSSDGGHANAQNPLFGFDPQARLDYGYQAVGTLTPMAKTLIAAAYGRGPDRSYFGGTSNGGRHAMVAAARYAAEYDGFIAVSPGFNLPKSAVAQLYGAQQWASVATNVNDLETALPLNERQLIGNAILARCDGLDGLVDGLVHDLLRCQRRFNLQRDVPTCPGERDGTCLTAAQKTAIGKVFAGARNSAAEALYSSFPYDPGLVSPGWASWKFRNSVGSTRDPVAVAFIFSAPPESQDILADTLGYALGFDFDVDAPKIQATSGIYAESAMSFMTPPNPARLDTLRNRGAKMIVIHGVSDGVFSVDDTAAWYRSVQRTYHGTAGRFVRFFPVPGMGHSRGGPATDQFDAIAAAVDWVERGQAPDRIVATARGPGNPGGANGELPPDWSPTRTRPLCPYPAVARYVAGDPEANSSFECRRSPGTPTR